MPDMLLDREHTVFIALSSGSIEYTCDCRHEIICRQYSQKRKLWVEDIPGKSWADLINDTQIEDWSVRVGMFVDWLMRTIVCCKYFYYPHDMEHVCEFCFVYWRWGHLSLWVMWPTPSIFIKDKKEFPSQAVPNDKWPPHVLFPGI